MGISSSRSCALEFCGKKSSFDEVVSSIRFKFVEDNTTSELFDFFAILHRVTSHSSIDFKKTFLRSVLVRFGLRHGPSDTYYGSLTKICCMKLFFLLLKFFFSLMSKVGFRAEDQDFGLRVEYREVGAEVKLKLESDALLQVEGVGLFEVGLGPGYFEVWLGLEQFWVL